MVPFDDHSTLIDELERIPLVEKLATAVMGCTPPRVFGLHGDWGAGKTSFLQQLHRTLDGIPTRSNWVAHEESTRADLTREYEAGTRKLECGFPQQRYDGEGNVLVVWFEAWRYQHEPAPVVALLHEMRGQLGGLVRLKNATLKIAEVVIRSGLLQLEQIAKFAWLQSAAAITVANKGAGLVTTIQEQGERWEREHLAEKLPAETIREQLEHAVDQLLGREKNAAPGEGRRVVVLIDDLDRCEPQATYRLLEGIKIYLNIPNCVFVLGMDQRIIEDAIAASAPGSKDNSGAAERRAREYLEKLFQEIYYLPIVQDVPGHLMAWLPKDPRPESAKTRAIMSMLLNEYEGCVPANPRKIKAFAAVLRRFLEEPDEGAITEADFAAIPQHVEVAAKYPYESLVLIMGILYHFHPEIYRHVEAHTAEFYEFLWRWCAKALNVEENHECLNGLDQAFSIAGAANVGANELPSMSSRYPDYSRGNVFRVQKLIVQARPFTKKQIQALLLK